MRLLAPFAVLVAALVAAVYLDRAPRRADVVFVNRGDVFTLDPQRMSYMQDLRMAYGLYEGLLRWTSAECKVVPAAASAWTVSEDRRTYTFTLRDDARWSSGDPVTAHDFVYSWQRAMLPDTAADYSNLSFVIDGAEDFFHWRTDQLASFAQRLEKDPQAAERLWEETQARYAASVGVRAIDGRTLEVRLRAPTAFFLELVCFPPLYPAHRPTVEGWPVDDKSLQSQLRAGGWHALAPEVIPAWDRRRWVRLDPVSGRFEQRHDWTKPGVLVGNGPYVLTQWRYRRDLRLERNPFFHSPQMVRNDTVSCISINDANTGVLAFESGQLDWLSDVAVEYLADMLEERRAYESRYASEISRMRGEGLTLEEALGRLPTPQRGERRNIHAFPTFGTDFYGFNCRPLLADGRANPFADARVRRAFTMSVDKAAVVQAATRLNEPIATSLIPPDSIPGFRSPAGLPFDPARARTELASAGWLDRQRDGVLRNERGEPFPIVDLLYTTNSPRYKNISLVLRDNWQTHLSVQVELRGEDSKFYKDDLKRGDYMIARGGWYGDYGDPTTFLDISRTGDGNNDRGYSSAYLDDLLDQASREPDVERRMRLLEEGERFLFDEEVPILPICRFLQTYMYEPGTLTGLTDHPRLLQYLWELNVKTPGEPPSAPLAPGSAGGTTTTDSPRAMNAHQQAPPGSAGG